MSHLLRPTPGLLAPDQSQSTNWDGFECVVESKSRHSSTRVECLDCWQGWAHQQAHRSARTPWSHTVVSCQRGFFSRGRSLPPQLALLQLTAVASQTERLPALSTSYSLLLVARERGQCRGTKLAGYTPTEPAMHHPPSLWHAHMPGRRVTSRSPAQARAAVTRRKGRNSKRPILALCLVAHQPVPAAPPPRPSGARRNPSKAHCDS